VVTAADEDTALAVDVVPGQAGDAPQLHRMLDRTEARIPVEEVVGDKAFDGDALRAGGLDRGIHTVIPNKANRVDPWPFDAAVYQERNRVERLFAKLKQFRRVATRYEKLKVTFLGMVHLTLGFIRLRKSVNVNTP
jgi:transposase